MNRPLSMLALMTDAFGGRGGIAQYNRDFLRAAAESRAIAEIVVLVRNSPDPVDPPPGIVQSEPVHNRTAYSLAAVFEILRRHIDVVFCGHLFHAPLAYAIARLSRTSLIIQVHGIEAWARPNRLIRFAAERADLILCVSRYTRARVLDWAAIQPEKVVVVPNTVDPRFIPGHGSALREIWNLQCQKILLTVARLDSRDHYKGHDSVISALPDLVAKGYDVVYAIVGEGKDVNRLKGLANEIGVADRVRFTGLIDRKTLVEAYQAADLFVMPSRGEGFGIAFLEAMASGTEAIGLDTAGARDALADGALGVLADRQNLAAAISDALARPKPNPVALHDSVRARFGHEIFRARITAILNEFLKAA